jgi:CubicO group peptidase (beta-lactamase class C family)
MISYKSQKSIIHYMDNIYMKGKKGCFFYGGNIKTNQDFFYSNGLANPTHPYTYDETLYWWASNGKLLTGILLVQMLEDNYFSMDDNLYLHGGSLYQGVGYYYKKIDIKNRFKFPYHPSSYHTEIEAFLWDNLTIRDTMSFNIPLPNDFLFYPATVFLWQKALYFPLDHKSKALLLQWYICSKKFHKALLTQNPEDTTILGWMFATKDIHSVTLTSWVKSMIDFNKKGEIPCAWKPHTKSDTRVDISSSGYYDFSYFIIGDILSKVAIKNGYKNLQHYAEEKVFKPLKMTHSYILGQTEIPKHLSSAQTSFQRSPKYGAIDVFDPNNPKTWNGAKCDPSYRMKCKDTPNGIVEWSSDYPIDIFYNVNSFFQLNIYQLKFNFYKLSCNGAAPFSSSIQDYGKLVQCIAKEGYYGNNKRLFTQKSWNLLLASQTNELVLFPTFINKILFKDRVFCLGMGKNKIKDSYHWFSVTGSGYFINYNTGYWFVYGTGAVRNSNQEIYSPSCNEKITQHLYKLIQMN